LKVKALIKKLLNFSGWSMLGSIAGIGSNQGIAMVLNIFLGVTINAAMGIANQVNTALNAFVSNFRVAFSPQIVKTYAAGNIDAHKKLLFQTSKFSYYLLLLLAIPVLLQTKFILGIWLTTVPRYAIVFTQLTILLSLIEALSGPFWMSVSAIGNIKIYQIVVSGILLLNLPLAYFVLFSDFSPEFVIIGKVLIGLILFIFRLLYVKQVLRFTMYELFAKLLKQVILVTILIISSLITIRDYFMILESTLLNICIFSLISILISLFFIAFIGINKMERISILNLLQNKFR
jgi:O-antigen/teichoic acid export membrane protein